MIVVKLGGSLYRHPALRTGLNHWLASIPSPIVLVPGGGVFADGVREFDRIHSIGDEAAHWAAIRSLAVSGDLLEAIVSRKDVEILDVNRCLRKDDLLPHSWDATSDSISLAVAIQRNAGQLILLKSMDRPMGSWDCLAELGYVDRCFPVYAGKFQGTIETLNFRSLLDGYIKVESR